MAPSFSSFFGASVVEKQSAHTCLLMAERRHMNGPQKIRHHETNRQVVNDWSVWGITQDAEFGVRKIAQYYMISVNSRLSAQNSELRAWTFELELRAWSLELAPKRWR